MRYNIFNKAYLPLKTALLSGCVFISKIVEQQPSKHAEAVEKVTEVLNIFNEQVTYEALHILPFIFEYEPSISSNYTSEHDKATRLSNNLKNLVKAYHKQKKEADKLYILSSINESFNGFTLFNFNHMDDEEAVLNEILWRYYQDKVLIQIEDKMDILPHLLKQDEPETAFHIAAAA